MAINPQIPLSVQTLDVGQAFNNALLNMQRAQSMQQQSQQFQSQQQQNDLKAAVTLAGPIRASLSGGDLGTARSLISRLPMEAQTEALQMLDRGDTQGLINLATQLESLAPRLGLTTGLASAKTQIFDNGTVIQALPDGSTVVQDPSGRFVTGQERTDVLQKARQEQVAFAGQKAAASARGTAGVEIETKPKIEAAVTAAKEAAKASVEQAGAERDNQTAWNVYQSGIESLSSALGGTETGPFVGLVPAITANQQIAEGAVSVMAPVLKQMFRSSGEGTFTDKDQELLLRMIPTRSDLPEARQAKLAGIDAIVRAKLNIGQTQATQPSEQAPVQTAPQQPSSGQRVGRFVIEVE